MLPLPINNTRFLAFTSIYFQKRQRRKNLEKYKILFLKNIFLASGCEFWKSAMYLRFWLTVVVRNHLWIDSNVRPNSSAISAFLSSVGFGFSEISLCKMVISSSVYFVKVPVAVFSPNFGIFESSSVSFLTLFLRRSNHVLT